MTFPQATEIFSELLKVWRTDYLHCCSQHANCVCCCYGDIPLTDISSQCLKTWTLLQNNQRARARTPQYPRKISLDQSQEGVQQVCNQWALAQHSSPTSQYFLWNITIRTRQHHQSCMALHQKIISCSITSKT